ncbi:alpha/beta hydrolase fold domain-containing protein [Nocardioides sambongensis]|uniref:alpha/beta hydrolase fold domain-containing protein n=1 Tax=Nocardioides sambongensis TaxID=2589074 RepID=UPI0018C89EBA|nr:alpha/beta hydrolase fold domain-containing protein [Nocardioides sambongensis]
MAPQILAAYRRTPTQLRSPWLLTPFDLSGPRTLQLLRRRTAVGGTGEHVEVVPPGRATPSGAVLWFHGGGHVAGSAEADRGFVQDLAGRLDAVVVAVDYRLAPEHPFPAGLEDAYAALDDLVRRSAGLGVDPDRIAVAGASAGAGLAAALCQLVRDRGEHRICFQALRYPMLDDRTRPARRGRHYVWSARSNRYAWECYLGRRGDTDPFPRPRRAMRRRVGWTTSPVCRRPGSAWATPTSSTASVWPTPSGCVRPVCR